MAELLPASRALSRAEPEGHRQRAEARTPPSARRGVLVHLRAAWARRTHNLHKRQRPARQRNQQGTTHSQCTHTHDTHTKEGDTTEMKPAEHAHKGRETRHQTHNIDGWSATARTPTPQTATHTQTKITMHTRAHTFTRTGNKHIVRDSRGRKTLYESTAIRAAFLPFSPPPPPPPSSSFHLPHLLRLQ